jgi:hypothetical protein
MEGPPGTTPMFVSLIIPLACTDFVRHSLTQALARKEKAKGCWIHIN